MTKTQFATLRWLADIGGVCVAWRDKVVHPDFAISVARRVIDQHRLHQQLTNRQMAQMPSVSALHLVQQGCIEARNGQLHISERGRRELMP